MINYQYNDLDAFANGKDDYYVGYDSTGAKTKDGFEVDPSKGGVGIDHHMIACRFQVAF